MGNRRRNRSRASRQRLAQRWMDSGLTAREFATAHGLTVSSLSRWARELREAQTELAGGGTFVDVTPPPSAAKPLAVRLTVGAVTVELDDLPPAEYLAALGRALC